MQQFNGPIFIIGMVRSGTKLLREILNGHSNISIPAYETECLIYWERNWHSFGDLSDYSVFKTFYKSAIKTPFFYYMRERGGGVISAKQWHDECVGFSVAEVFEALVRNAANARHKIIWGDKSPSYIRHVPLLKTLYPEAKFIHIVRDVRDYCLSINKAWGKNMIRAAQRWVDDVSEAHRNINMLGDDGIEVLYEDLLDDPMMVSRNLCKFLGVEFEESMIRLANAVENIGDAKDKLDIIKNNKEKWKKGMTEDLINEIEAITGPLLMEFNYPVTYSGKLKRVSQPRMRWYQILDAWNLVINNPETELTKSLLFHLKYFKVTGNRVK